MIDRDHALPLARQAQQLGISRGSIYYLPRPVTSSDVAIMRRIDELHLLYPFAGSRMLRDLLRQEGVEVGRLHVASLMKRMRIEAIYRRPNTSKPAPGHKIYPYLLRKLAVRRPNQVWATDITYVPMARGFVYLVAIVDWFTRRVLAHESRGRVSNISRKCLFYSKTSGRLHLFRSAARLARGLRYDADLPAFPSCSSSRHSVAGIGGGVPVLFHQIEHRACHVDDRPVLREHVLADDTGDILARNLPERPQQLSKIGRHHPILPDLDLADHELIDGSEARLSCSCDGQCTAKCALPA